jgi:RNA polymerase sigma-70 factor, ECF subfamily
MGAGGKRQTNSVEPSAHTSSAREPSARSFDSAPASASADALTSPDPSEPPVPSVVRPLDFRTIFELEVGYVMRTLRRLSVAPADLEDLAHEVFLAVHQQLHRYDTARPLRPWLFGFAFRIASHYRRKARRETALEDVDSVIDAADAPDAALEKERRRQIVLAALDEIELSRRAVFVLHELDGFTCEEISRTLEIPIGTTYSRLRLARRDFSETINRLRARRAIG